MNRYFCASFCIVLALLALDVSSAFRLTCRDEGNQDVDWYVNYKIPRLDNRNYGTDISKGKAYSYISSSQPGNWKLSSNSITSASSMLALTMQPFYDNKKNITYLFYNDEPPPDYNGTSNGHLKGVVAFGDKGGIWLVHSIPKFGNIDEYEYPKNALHYGQSVLCVSFDISSLNEICKQLLHCSPKIYERQVTDAVLSFLDSDARSIFSEKPSFNRKPPFKRVTSLKSSGREVFVSFAKDGQFEDDVYSSVIAPTLRTSLATETWRRGSGGYLPPNCETSYTVTDIASINMTVKVKNRNGNISFLSTDDHSKWAVSVNAGQYWICVGDMNRMASQAKRGGGSLCFQSSKVANAYQSIISSADQCPDGW